jgi:hypothetical protein
MFKFFYNDRYNNINSQLYFLHKRLLLNRLTKYLNLIKQYSLTIIQQLCLFCNINLNIFI